MRSKLSDIVTDVDIVRVNPDPEMSMGDKRALIVNGIFRVVFGYPMPFGQWTILKDHKLIHAARENEKRAALSERGRHYLRISAGGWFKMWNEILTNEARENDQDQ